jgi:hypothetical protein
VEHVVPTSKGGLDEESNLALACRACNLFKSDQQGMRDEITGEVVRLYHPRLDRWDEHLRVALGNGEIHGLSPIGRATVACLQMNRELQRIARLSWMKLKLYP